jgi:hypothetical protein
MPRSEALLYLGFPRDRRFLEILALAQGFQVVVFFQVLARKAPISR